MKILAGTTLALAISIASMGPALTGPALSQTNSVVTGRQVTSQVESIDGSTMVVRTPDGTTRTYEIDPAAIASLKLSQGSTVLVNPNLISGKIIRIGPQNALVKLDNGKTQNFLITREGRVTLAAGERIVITPDQRISRAENYLLTAKDVVSVQPIATTTTDTTSTVRTEAETSTTTTEATPPSTIQAAPPASSTPTVEETQPPVRALW